MDEAGKGGRSRGGFSSGGPRGGRFSGSRGRGGRGGGYSRGESCQPVNMLCVCLQLLLHIASKIVMQFQVADTMATGVTVTGATVTEASEVETGALAVADTGVEDIPQAVTEKTGEQKGDLVS